MPQHKVIQESEAVLFIHYSIIILTFNQTHPSFENRWLTVFKYRDLISEESIRNRINEYKINTVTQRIGIKSILNNTYLPSNIRNPAFEMALAAMRSETHVIKFKSHPTGEFRNCAIGAESCNNTAHILLHCPISLYVWEIVVDLIKILTGIKIKPDPKLKLLNFTDNPMFCKAKKIIIKIVNILVISKRVIFTMYYRGDGSIKSADILEEFRKNIKLTIKYMCENAIFLNISLDVYMKFMLGKSFKLLGNLIRNRPSLHFYILKYKGVLSSNN